MNRRADWHDNARSLYSAGWTQKEIVDHLDKPQSSVWSALHPEKMKVSRSAWRERHPEKISEFNRRQYEKNVAANRARSRDWKLHNRGRATALQCARHALQVGATVGDRASIKEIYRRAHDETSVRCYLCGTLIPIGDREVDHIVPLSRGGKHTASNLAIACSRCNQRKHTRLPEEA